jgi:tetratricopeptide (TPR) repeat protein
MPLIESLLQKNPCDLVALGNRATLYSFQKEYEKSLASWKKAIGCDSTQVLLWHQLALTYRAVNKEDSAKFAWEQGLKLLTPDDKLYAQIQNQMKQKKQK